MSMKYTVYPDLGVTVFTFRGDVFIQDNVAILLQYLQDPLFDGRQNVLFDVADCSFPDTYYSDMMRLTYKLEPYYAMRDPASCTGFYAPDDLAYGMSRMYMSAVGAKASHALEVFRTVAEALRYVGLDPLDPNAQALLRPE